MNSWRIRKTGGYWTVYEWAARQQSWRYYADLSTWDNALLFVDRIITWDKRKEKA